jgi:hypothetical protein
LLLEKPLPVAQRGVAHADLTFTLEQVGALSPLDLFDELQAANRELLQTLLQLAAQRAPAVETTAAPKQAMDAA